jgi:hypothetical protein
MIEANDQSLEYVGYQVPRAEIEPNSEETDKSQPQGLIFEFFDSKKFNCKINFLIFRVFILLGVFSCQNNA